MSCQQNTSQINEEDERQEEKENNSQGLEAKAQQSRGKKWIKV
jgi:hypothetical protein